MTNPPDHPLRRATDHPDMVERVISLETNVAHVKHAVDDLNVELRGHITDESSDIRSMALAVERISIAHEHQAKTMDRMAATLDTVAAHAVRVKSLEDWREKVDDKIEATHDRVDLIYKVIGIAVPVAIAAWTVLTYFKVF